MAGEGTKIIFECSSPSVLSQSPLIVQKMFPKSLQNLTRDQELLSKGVKHEIFRRAEIKTNKGIDRRQRFQEHPHGLFSF